MTIQGPALAGTHVPAAVQAIPKTEGTSPSHHLTICVTCRDTQTGERPGQSLGAALASALQADADWSISGVECMAACGLPCAVALTSPGKTGWLFGNLTLEDVPDIAAFARQYHGLADGWCKASERPGRMAKTALARIPAPGRTTAFEPAA
ncbi:Predicted metal-binding protein [Pannonibacter phragmitetus]|uniref:Predicted metal-binding protein n=1 Tax=Pannonibacter phragmitetus TaxID=121719 RepID=A0A378ZZY3_9HYPH|nr:DUF1636 domain-containing protein [Pannonibacter phragmitetus]SUB02687.1 Predicted metal-binding protein [Pannonibacter phragmitetus]